MTHRETKHTASQLHWVSVLSLSQLSRGGAFPSWKGEFWGSSSKDTWLSQAPSYGRWNRTYHQYRLSFFIVASLDQIFSCLFSQSVKLDMEVALESFFLGVKVVAAIESKGWAGSLWYRNPFWVNFAKFNFGRIASKRNFLRYYHCSRHQWSPLL